MTRPFVESSRTPQDPYNPGPPACIVEALAKMPGDVRAAGEREYVAKRVWEALLAEGHLIETAVLSAYLGGHTGQLLVIPLASSRSRARDEETKP